MAMQLSVGLSEDLADDLADEFLPRLTHPAYLALAHTFIERIAAYRNLRGRRELIRSPPSTRSANAALVVDGDAVVGWLERGPSR
jgi:hypothetical protein